jgi:prepilin-type N-terminal cleavage/methylation domain-containing protein
MLAVERKGEMRYRLGVTSRRQNKNSAFTLTELLVVITVVSSWRKPACLWLCSVCKIDFR